MMKLHRSRDNKMLAGVCGGIAETYDQDPTLVRLAAIALTLWSLGLTSLAYIVAWMLIPDENEVYQAKEVDVEEK